MFQFSVDCCCTPLCTGCFCCCTTTHNEVSIYITGFPTNFSNSFGPFCNNFIQTLISGVDVNGLHILSYQTGVFNICDVGLPEDSFSNNFLCTYYKKESFIGVTSGLAGLTCPSCLIEVRQSLQIVKRSEFNINSTGCLLQYTLSFQYNSGTSDAFVYIMPSGADFHSLDSPILPLGEACVSGYLYGDYTRQCIVQSCGDFFPEKVLVNFL